MTDETASEITSARHPFKRAAWIAVAVVNAVTLCNSFLVADKVMQRAEGEEVPAMLLGGTVLAPGLTYLQWTHPGEYEQDSDFGRSPITSVSRFSHKVAPDFVSNVGNAAFTIAGAPGAMVGNFTGSVMGLFSTPPAKNQTTPAPAVISP